MGKKVGRMRKKLGGSTVLRSPGGGQENLIFWVSVKAFGGVKDSIVLTLEDKNGL
jgi:hypothetical protein